MRVRAFTRKTVFSAIVFHFLPIPSISLSVRVRETPQLGLPRRFGAAPYVCHPEPRGALSRTPGGRRRNSPSRWRHVETESLGVDRGNLSRQRVEERQPVLALVRAEKRRRSATEDPGICENERRNNRRREVSLSASRVNWCVERSAADRKAPHATGSSNSLEKISRESFDLLFRKTLVIMHFTAIGLPLPEIVRVPLGVRVRRGILEAIRESIYS